MIIRVAEPQDADCIGQVRVKAWQAAYRAYMPAIYLSSLDPNANLSELRTILLSAQPPFLMKVAEVAGEVSAFSILGTPRYQASAETMELWALNVAPQHWRKGIGRSLVNQALVDAKQRGARRVELWCISGNTAACSLYEQCGFTNAGNERTTSALTGLPLHEVAYARMLE